MQIYQRFFAENGEGFGTSNRVPQTCIVGDVQTCVDTIVAFIHDFGITDLVTWTSPPGLHPKVMNANLERLIREVVPAVRARLAC